MAKYLLFCVEAFLAQLDDLGPPPQILRVIACSQRSCFFLLYNTKCMGMSISIKVMSILKSLGEHTHCISHFQSVASHKMKTCM